MNSAMPSPTFTTRLPANPSHMMTSTAPLNTSLPSTFPIKFRSVLANRALAAFVSSFPLVASSPMLSRPTRGFFSFSTRSAYSLPITANWSRFSTLQSTLAPLSSMTALPLVVGTTAPIAGRSIPSILPSVRVATAIAAPVLPALTNAWASPLLTRSAATATDESGFRRIAFAGCSSICTISDACFISAFDPEPGYFANSRWMRSRSPTKIACTPSLEAASSAPLTVSIGAWSPPITSTAIFMEQCILSTLSSLSAPRLRSPAAHCRNRSWGRRDAAAEAHDSVDNQPRSAR